LIVSIRSSTLRHSTSATIFATADAMLFFISALLSPLD
jgi:hypothetical protein